MASWGKKGLSKATYNLKQTIRQVPAANAGVGFLSDLVAAYIVRKLVLSRGLCMAPFVQYG
jgi:hypothetical protein